MDDHSANDDILSRVKFLMPSARVYPADVIQTPRNWGG